MGKKAKLKKIRRIAEAMPIINTRRVHATIVTGEELLKKGVKDVKGQEVDPNINYREKKIVSVPLNHNRKMKKLYQMNGMNAVKMYMGAVKQYEEKRNAAK